MNHETHETGGAFLMSTYDDWKTTEPGTEDCCQVCGERLTAATYTREYDGEREREAMYGEWCDGCIINDLSQGGDR